MRSSGWRAPTRPWPRRAGRARASARWRAPRRTRASRRCSAEATAAAQRKLADARGRLTAAVQVERTKLEAESSQVAAEAARKILGREVTT